MKVILCEIEDRAAFNQVVRRSVFPHQRAARLWAEAFIENRRLKAIRKYGHDFQEGLFGLEPNYTECDFDPIREPLDAEA
jgi:hypothetical protein